MIQRQSKTEKLSSPIYLIHRCRVLWAESGGSAAHSVSRVRPVSRSLDAWPGQTPQCPAFRPRQHQTASRFCSASSLAASTLTTPFSQLQIDMNIDWLLNLIIIIIIN